MFDVIEDALVAKSIEALTVNGQQKVRTVAALPGDLRDANTLRELAKSAPAVYWAFLGGSDYDNNNDIQLDSVWGCYIVTDHASGIDARRRGDGRQIGAYDIMKLLLPVINGYTIPDAGTAMFKRVENLFSIHVDKVGVALYAATFNIRMPLDYALDTTTLSAFQSYYDTQQIGDANVPDLGIDQTLPQ